MLGLLALGAGLAAGAMRAAAQTDPLPAPAPEASQTSALWTVVGRGLPPGLTLEFGPSRGLGADPRPGPEASPGLEAGAAQALGLLQGLGYPLARVDSADALAATLYVTPGPRVPVSRVEVEGAGALPPATLTLGWATRRGEPLDPEALDADLALALSRYAEAGLPGAVLRPEVRLERGPTDGALGLVVTVRVDEGERPRLARMVLVDASGRPSRTRGAFAARVAGLSVGDPLGPFRPEAVRQELEGTGLFARVGDPSLALDPAGEALIVVPVEDAAPGAFSLVLGYLPPAGGQGGGLVGSGELALGNLGGRGRVARVALVRLPGLVSSLELEAAEPYVFGLPLEAGLAFDGLAQDSLFARQRYRGELALRVATGLWVEATASREAVQPGRAGAALVDGRPRVSRSGGFFGGLGLRARALDAALFPRRGFAADVLVEQGQLGRALSGAEGGVSQQARQRLAASLRGYVPTFPRHALALGIDARVLVGGRGVGGEGAPAYDEAELFRFGGAASLRGYDEDAFLGNAAGRALAEYRVGFDATSFVFAFADLGYVARPALPGLAPLQDWLPGYGLGAALQTGLGRTSITYALNPNLPLGRGKLHLGLLVGL